MKDAHDRAGYPVIARMSVRTAFSVYARMRDIADALRWPWQRKRREALRFDAWWLLTRALWEMRDEGNVDVKVWSHREEPFSTVYRRVIEECRESLQRVERPEYEDEVADPYLRAGAMRAI